LISKSERYNDDSDDNEDEQIDDDRDNIDNNGEDQIIVNDEETDIAEIGIQSFHRSII